MIRIVRVFVLPCAAVIGVVALDRTTAQEPSTPGSPLTQIAYLKASNAEGSDHFACGGSLPGHTGNALALSGDGNTLAVGAPHESSAARGINGNQNDNSLYNSGAVYVYARRGSEWIAAGVRQSVERRTQRHVRIDGCLEPRRKHDGRGGVVGGKRRHRRERQSG